MISVIIPTYDEACNPYFEEIVQNITEQDGEKEIIIVERSPQANIRDRLSATQQHGRNFQVFHMPDSNRARAMNFGLKQTRGDIVLFHHPVSFLPKRTALQEIQKVLQDPKIVGGGFIFDFTQKHWLLQMGARRANKKRSRQKKLFYLDQCIFCRKRVAEAIGGFPEIALFEEKAFCKNLRKKGDMVVINALVKTSAHKFLKQGIFRQWLKNRVLGALFVLGISPRLLNKWYGRQ